MLMTEPAVGRAICYGIGEGDLMQSILVCPTAPLSGEVSVGGSKNAALPILAATLLCDGPCIIGNLPAIRDVSLCLSLLTLTGAAVEKVGPRRFRIDPRGAGAPCLPDELTKCLRASSYFLGAGLGAFGSASIGQIGGCDFGGRPVDQHIKAFSALGARVEERGGVLSVSADRLTGAHVRFDTVSVGATVNALLAAVRAEGVTVLENAAREPHISDLVCFLNQAGADISGAGTDRLTVRGVPRLHGVCYEVIPDMIEAGTYLLAAAATRGRVAVRGIAAKTLSSLLLPLRQMGCVIEEGERSLSLAAPRNLLPVCLETAPYPGFPTDLHPPAVALLCTVRGKGEMRERVWPRRFRYVEELCRMGANLLCEGDAVSTLGGELVGTELHIPDLRAGAALLIAALAARGESRLSGVGYIERGYEDFIDKFSALGADIRPLT